MADTSLVPLTVAERSPQTTKSSCLLYGDEGALGKQWSCSGRAEIAADFSDGGHSINSSPGSIY
jgi:hypothetical protein